MAETMLVPADLPMRPWDYVRRRRLLAGLTIEQAARPFWKHEAHRADVVHTTRMIETEHVVMKPWVARETRRAFDFDPAIYRQLTDLPMFHPTLCRCCGSADAEPRITREGSAAAIADEGICTACHEDRAEHGRRRWAA